MFIFVFPLTIKIKQTVILRSQIKTMLRQACARSCNYELTFCSSYSDHSNSGFQNKGVGKPVPVAARSAAWVCGHSLAGVAGSNPVIGTWMSVCCECCVSSRRGPCDGLITLPEESYRVGCV
jgi:hypothetical protein